MSRSPAKSGNATAMKSLKEKWLSIVQSVREKGEKGIGGFSTVTVGLELSQPFGAAHTSALSSMLTIFHKEPCAESVLDCLRSGSVLDCSVLLVHVCFPSLTMMSLGSAHSFRL